MGSICSRGLWVCAVCISRPDTVTNYVAADTNWSPCAGHTERAWGRPYCPLFGDAGSPHFIHEELEVHRREVMYLGLCNRERAVFPNSPTLKPQARPTVPHCLLSRSMWGRTLKCPPRGALTSQSENQFPGLDVEGDGSNAGLELPLNGK